MLLPDDVSTEDLERLVRIIDKHRTAFAHDDLDIGKCDLIPFKINMVDDKPFSHKYRHIPHKDLREVRQLIETLLDRKIIEHSTSPYASIAVILRKKSGKLRLTCDYRTLL